MRVFAREREERLSRQGGDATGLALGADSIFVPDHHRTVSHHDVLRLLSP